MSITKVVFKEKPDADDHSVTYTVTISLENTTTTRDITLRYAESINELKLDTITDVTPDASYKVAADTKGSYAPDQFNSDLAKFTLVGTANKEVTIDSVEFEDYETDTDTATPNVVVTMHIGAASKTITIPLSFGFSNNQYHLDQFQASVIQVDPTVVPEADTTEFAAAHPTLEHQFFNFAAPENFKYSVTATDLAREAAREADVVFEVVPGSFVKDASDDSVFYADFTFKLGSAVRHFNHLEVVLAFPITQVMADNEANTIKQYIRTNLGAAIADGIITEADINKFVGS